MPSAQQTHIRIFLSSPGDVAEERAIALRVIEQINNESAFRDHANLESVAWDKKGAGVPLLASLTPQEAVNSGLKRPSECDIVVVIFWARMGTPLPDSYIKPDGSRYLSGTEWEFEDAMDAARASGGKPYILVYRRMDEPVIGLRDPQRNEKIAQWERVEAFFAGFVNADGSLKQGYHQYTGVAEFEEQFAGHLRNLIHRIAPITDNASGYDEPALLSQVRAAAAEWDRNTRHDAYLWPHERLKPVHDWIAQNQAQSESFLDEVTRDFLRPEAERLQRELRDPRTEPVRRAAIGYRLAEIGDPRPGVGLNANNLPDVDWCEVPGGVVTIDDRSYAVEPFRISRYQVTYSQYRCFATALDGYVNARWWDGLAARQVSPGVQTHEQPNHPAENVSWYDAVAFCRWLSSKLGYEVCLPTDAEWQLAAMNQDRALLYPWGAIWGPGYANTLESGVGRTTAVGMYPHGASACGALDLVGNVWEWCLNNPTDVQNPALDQPLKRSLRGGAFSTSKGKTRITYRGQDDPKRRRGGIGFRIATETRL